ncbi:MAG TPA: diaminopimelate epimerase [Vicinamibacterales bacterium]|nr:diaminopimelate epimerase [Vicinamibacterales bacterium]
MTLVKAHALGNDFLLMESTALPEGRPPAGFARAVCDRHRGIGADGLILYDTRPGQTAMRLLNADGSPSEISGNGVRCLAALLARSTGVAPGGSIDIETDAGMKRLHLLSAEPPRYSFRASMGQPEQIARVALTVAGSLVEVVTLRVGNPQCVVLGEATESRLHSVAAALAVHPHFPHGTNVELAEIVSAGHVRILIWERGVGPTEASGTGACAAAVAAIRFAGAPPDVEVHSPGGVQRVEWHDDGLFLTGWAELIGDVRLWKA